LETKYYVLQTNILLHFPEALFAFKENNVVLTSSVIKELEGKKKADGEIGKNARASLDYIEKLREQGDILKGVEINSDKGKIFIDQEDYSPQHTCSVLKDSGKDAILVTKKLSEKIQADIFGIPSEDFHSDMVKDPEHQYKGQRTITVDPETIDKFMKEGKLEADTIAIYNEKEDYIKLLENEYIHMVSVMGDKQSALGCHSKGIISKLVYENYHPYGITARGAKQHFAIDALMRDPDDSPLIILKGPAGTAKTFLAMAAGLDRVNKTNVKDRDFRKILVCRPNILMDEELGFLPGNEKEKIEPLMRPIFDNLETLIDSDDKERYMDEIELSRKVETLFISGIIVTQAVGYLRGRSIPNTFIFIDEAQNVTPATMKGIISRVAKGTIIVLCGDPEQVDHPYLNEKVNGISYASERLKDHKLVRQITFDISDCERSPLAKLVSERM
jgi:PhoH-like ATPase